MDDFKHFAGTKKKNGLRYEKTEYKNFRIELTFDNILCISILKYFNPSLHICLLSTGANEILRTGKTLLSSIAFSVEIVTFTLLLLKMKPIYNSGR